MKWLALAPALLGALAARADDWPARRDACERDLASGDASRRASALDALAAADRPEAVALLLNTAAAAARRIDGDLDAFEREADAQLRGLLASLSAPSLTTRERRTLTDQEAEIRRLLRDVDDENDALRDLLSGIAGALGRMSGEAAVWRLLQASRSSLPWRVKRAVIEGLSDSASPAAGVRLAELLGRENDLPSRVAAADALGARPVPESVPPLLAALPGAPTPLTLAVARALDALDDPAAVPPLLTALRAASGRPREAVRSALARLTGRDLPPDPGAWEAWWSGAAEEFASVRGDRSARAALRPGPSRTAATFYGLPVTSTAVAFCIDVSESMRAKTGFAAPPGVADRPRGNRRLDVALFELRCALRALPGDARFNLLFFARAPEWMSPTALLQATPANLGRAFDWADRAEPDFGTNLYDTLERCLAAGRGSRGGEEDPRKAADTIYLLTDGAPSCGSFVRPEAILRRVRDLNATARAAIHTVGIAPSPAARSFLQALAEENEGECVLRGDRIDSAPPR